MNPLLHLFLVTFTIGAFTFGGGYAIIPVLKGEMVDRWHWVTPQEFGYAIAIGQITPGPISVLIAFIGWRIAGIAGAVVATAGLHLPAFLSVLVIAKFFAQIRRQPRIQGMVEAIQASMAALLITVAFDLGKSIMDKGPLPILMALLSLLITFFTRINPSWIFIGSILLGLLFHAH